MTDEKDSLSQEIGPKLEKNDHCWKEQVNIDHCNKFSTKKRTKHEICIITFPFNQIWAPIFFWFYCIFSLPRMQIRHWLRFSKIFVEKNWVLGSKLRKMHNFVNWLTQMIHYHRYGPKTGKKWQSLNKASQYRPL